VCFFFSVYVFDPATPRPVAVQSNVSKKADVVSAAFDPGYLSCSSTKHHSIKMSKLYFLNHNQVSLLFSVLITVNGRVPKKPADVSKNCTTDTKDQLAGGHFWVTFWPCFRTNIRAKPFMWKWVCFALTKALVGGTPYMDDVAGRLVLHFPRNGQLTSCDKTFDILF